MTRILNMKKYGKIFRFLQAHPKGEARILVVEKAGSV